MNGRKTISILIVCFLLSTVIAVSAVCVQSYNEERRPAEIDTEFIRYDSYGNYVIDIDTESFYNCGYRDGDYVILSWGDFSTRALVVPSFNGLLIFEYFIHTSPDGEVCVARQCAGCDLEIGDKINIRFFKESNRDVTMPKYNDGECARAEWMTDEDYLNFRCVDTTGMKKDMLYRSYDVFANDSKPRSAVIDGLLDKYDIGQIVNMKTSSSSLKKMVDSEAVVSSNACWYVNNDQFFAENMSVNIINDPKDVDLLEYIADNEGPFLIHCTLGKDRTGFIVMLLESLMGATYEEMKADYCYSYLCLYDIELMSKEYEMTEKMFDAMMIAFHDPDLLKTDVDIYSLDIDPTQFDYVAVAESYITESLGMSSETIDKIRDRLSSD